MPVKRLNEMVLRNLAPPRSGQVAIMDEMQPNFGVRVSQGGTISYFVLYRDGIRRKRVTLGTYPVVTLSDARALARKHLAKVTLEDRNPFHLPVVCFSDAVEQFLQLHCSTRNKPRTAAETERLLRRHWLTVFKARGLADIRTHDISKVADDLADTPGTARNAIAALRKLFAWARQRRYVTANPCEGMALPARMKARDRVLSDAEIVRVWQTARSFGHPYGTIVKLLLLTGQRRNEIAALRWSFMDEEARTITLPPELTKNSREHVFPYGAMASHAIWSTLREHDLLFPARGNPGNSFSGWSKCKAAFDAQCGIEPWRLHDLRRTMATGLAALGTPVHVTERLLNHVSGTFSGIVSVYQRHSYLPEMRTAMDAWEGKLAALIGDEAIGSSRDLLEQPISS